MGTKIPYLLLRSRFISETDNGIECKFQCKINHGPEWNVKFMIPIQTPYGHLSNCWVLKRCEILPYKIFSSKLEPLIGRVTFQF